jgi:hypothetical protein
VTDVYEWAKAVWFWLCVGAGGLVAALWLADKVANYGVLREPQAVLRLGGDRRPGTGAAGPGERRAAPWLSRRAGNWRKP